MNEAIDVEKLLQKWVRGTYEIVDGVVNVEGDVLIKDWKKDKLPVQFGTVTQHFSCHLNRLVSLEGAPEEVAGNFYCSDNRLASLEGGPMKVDGNFSCSFNRLTSIEGAPKEVGGSFACYNNLTKFTEEDVKQVSNVKGKIIV